ncbi:hypothetical protein [Hymenobacter lapidiphilus]|nr:hypothetical protein [Hymenobacter sp. CCM 8763]
MPSRKQPSSPPQSGSTRGAAQPRQHPNIVAIEALTGAARLLQGQR